MRSIVKKSGFAKKMLIAFLHSSLILGIGAYPLSARDLCPSGQELSSTSFSCVPSSSGRAMNNDVANIAAGLAGASAILDLLDALSNMPKQNGVRRSHQAPTVIKSPLPNSIKVRQARVKAANDYVETCFKQDRVIRDATQCAKIAAKLLRKVGDEAQASMLEVIDRDQLGQIEIDPGCNSEYPTVARGAVCKSRDSNISDMVTTVAGVATCCVTAEYGQASGLSTKKLSLRDQINEK